MRLAAQQNQSAQSQHHEDSCKGQPVPPSVVRVSVRVFEHGLAPLVGFYWATVAVKFVNQCKLYAVGKWEHILKPTQPSRDQVRRHKESRKQYLRDNRHGEKLNAEFGISYAGTNYHGNFIDRFQTRKLGWKIIMKWTYKWAARSYLLAVLDIANAYIIRKSHMNGIWNSIKK